MYKIYDKEGLLTFVKANKSELETLSKECETCLTLAEREGKELTEEVRFMSHHGKMEWLRHLVANSLKVVETLSCYKRDVPLLRAMYQIEQQVKGNMGRPKTKPYWRVHGQTDRYCFDNFNSNSLHLMTLDVDNMLHTTTLTYDMELGRWVYNPAALTHDFPSLDKAFMSMSIYAGRPVTKYELSHPWIFADISKVFNKSFKGGFTPRDVQKLQRTCLNLLFTLL